MSVISSVKDHKIAAAIILFVIVIFLLLILFRRTEVKAFKVYSHDAIRGVTVTGTVESNHDLNLSTNITGRIKELRFKEGDYVSKGQLLAIIDPQEALGSLLSAKGQLISAEAQIRNLLTEPRIQQAAIARAQVKEVQNTIAVQNEDLNRARIQLQDAISNETRLTRLYQQGAVSFREAEVARLARQQVERIVRGLQSQIQVTRDRLAEARQNLSLIEAGTKPEQIQVAEGQVIVAKGGIETTVGRVEDYYIKAPITGYIVQKILDKGEVISPTTSILRLVEPRDLYINAQVEEKDSKNVKPGQSAYIIFDAYPTRSFKQKVTGILTNVNPITGTFEAKISIPRQKGVAILTGMSSDVTIVTKEIKNAIIIPSEFVYTQEKEKFVYRLVGGQAVKTIVRSELFNNSKVVIKEGLKAGDIVVKGYTRKPLKQASLVKVKEYYKE